MSEEEPQTLRAWIGRGPLEVEARLLGELERQVEAGRRAPELLSAPIRVVVPSSSLARHVEAALVRRTGTPVLGVAIRTLHALAQEILSRAGVEPPIGELLFPVLLRQAARSEPSLAELAALDDGYAVVEANVRDLLDAGFEAPHAEAFEEAVAQEAAGAQRARAQAVVRVAARVAAGLESGAAGHPSQQLRRAREALERDPGVLPTRALLLHGFADATGVQLDLLEALSRLPQAIVLLDRPRDPADPTCEDSGVAFTRRVSERLGVPAVARDAAPLAAAQVDVLHAPGVEAEVRAVAERVAERLAAGACPPNASRWWRETWRAIAWRFVVTSRGSAFRSPVWAKRARRPPLAAASSACWRC